MNDNRWLPLLLVILVLTAALVGAFVGHRATLAALNENAGSAFSLQREVDELKTELAQQEGELEMLRTRSEVDRRALGMVRGEISGHKEREAELEEALKFYRSLMAPEDVSEGISMRAPELVATEEPGRYSYRLVVQQEARKHELVSGKISLEVIGERAGLEVSYPLAELSDTFTEDTTELNFRYFQILEGEFTLPPGLEPTEFAVRVQASKPRRTELAQGFPWQLQERFTHVGK